MKRVKKELQSETKFIAVWLRFFCLFVSISLCAGCSLLGGDFKYEPQELPHKISPEAMALIDKAYEGIDPSKLRDYHVHIAGLNPKKTGTFVNEDWQSPLHLTSYITFQVYKSASGIKDEEHADSQYLDRLKSLIQYAPQKGKYGILAFDYFHDENGQPDLSLTTFRVPNDYLLGIANSNRNIFFPVISIHPYREDGAGDLEHYAEKGVKFVKWLPNSMGINPSSEEMKEKLQAYYRVMKKYDMTLISHTGDEVATEAEETQHFGNPLLLKMPLDMGVKVIMSHMASLGKCKKVESSLCPPGTSYIDLAIEMMKEKYENTLFADIAALTQYNRQHNLDKVLSEKSIHSRLVNGSDYPLPAVNIVIRTRSLVKSGHITASERKLLNEIYDFNPLLFDFVLKRTLRHSKTGQKFPDSIFMENKDLLTE